MRNRQVVVVVLIFGGDRIWRRYCLDQSSSVGQSACAYAVTNIMQPDKPSSSHPAAGHSEAVADVAKTNDAMARRRLLMKSVGKGAAVVAAATPLQSLAAGGLVGQLCTVSGIQSNVGSGRTGGTTDNCSGFAPSHFETPANWPAVPFVVTSTSLGSVSVTDQQTFDVIFGSGNAIKLIDIFVPPPSVTPTLSERIWAAALLGAQKKSVMGLGPSSPSSPGYFPYTPAEIRDLYATNRAAAESFLAGYVQGEL